ncbi:cbb3-type cytochrome c oxidase subunit 3 [Bradyrhizobium sp. WD16]|uniref:cbb3-type cytochrome oxidase subunit 3 n=1 Tax=Bradyrhizobium sp. WD16 TaxID=1521768 RepID=UPI0020A5D76C|nr:cbb3-type cytochrome c oxidase subunit 3 [Bradyrhizobium sp. WD16]UTD29818.1 CcoQ/FixQ family Cbb3-type cytochrome c oxidase assembly chaperone [Bradyrhizobium sp. WD16]
MKAIVNIENIASDVVLTVWTPLFVAIFIAIVAYALWPRNKATFDAASKLPLREE